MDKAGDKTQFLGGFGSEDLVEEFYMEKNQDLRPGTIFSENDQEYKIELGVPFMRKEDMEVDLTQDKLIVEANRKIPKEQREKKHYKGIFHIADDVNKDGIAVDFNDGMLAVTFPKN